MYLIQNALAETIAETTVASTCLRFMKRARKETGEARVYYRYPDGETRLEYVLDRRGLWDAQASERTLDAYLERHGHRTELGLSS